MPTYFFDNCISPKLVAMLAALELGDELLHIRTAEGIDRNADDVVWMPIAAEREWIAITVDNAIRRKVREKLVREQVQLRVIYFPGGFASLVFWEQVKFLVKVWDDVRKHGAKCKQGQCFELSMNGKVSAI